MVHVCALLERDVNMEGVILCNKTFKPLHRLAHVIAPFSRIVM